VNWFIVEQPQNLSLTTITFIKDALIPPKGPSDDSSSSGGEDAYPDNFDGNNRNIQPLRNRVVQYFDREHSCTPYEPPKKVLIDNKIDPETFRTFRKT